MNPDFDVGQFRNPRDQAKEETGLINRSPVGSLRKSGKKHALRLLLLAILPAMTATACEPSKASVPSGTPGHVFVINLENKGYDEAWGPFSAAPYLSGPLRSQGVLLEEYYGIAHNSTPNYLAEISGQPPNAMTRKDCPFYALFVQAATTDRGQAEGDGCVYPASVPTVAGQLTAAGKSWKGYIEDMKTPCKHPALGARDNHRLAVDGDQYATRHNPFVYFESITSSPECRKNDVDLAAVAGDLKSVATTPNLPYITPNLCHDGHDSPCADGTPGGLAAADRWLSLQVPAIMNPPAYRQDGMLIIAFDEADGGAAGPPGVAGGTEGGKVGTLVLSPFSSGGTSSDRPYNHYSLLASVEDFFSLPRLGSAGDPGVNSFGADVYHASR